MTSVAAAKCEDAQICSEHAAAAEESALAARVANLRKTLSDATEAGSRLGTARAEGQAAFERVLSDCSARVAAQKAAADAFAQRLSAARQTAAGTQRELDAVRRTQRVAALRDEEVACTGRDESCAGAKQLSEQNVKQHQKQVSALSALQETVSEQRDTVVSLLADIAAEEAASAEATTAEVTEALDALKKEKASQAIALEQDVLSLRKDHLRAEEALLVLEDSFAAAAAARQKAQRARVATASARQQTQDAVAARLAAVYDLRRVAAGAVATGAAEGGAERKRARDERVHGARGEQIEAVLLWLQGCGTAERGAVAACQGVKKAAAALAKQLRASQEAAQEACEEVQQLVQDLAALAADEKTCSAALDEVREVDAQQQRTLASAAATLLLAGDAAQGSSAAVPAAKKARRR